MEISGGEEVGGMVAMREMGATQIRRTFAVVGITPGWGAPTGPQLGAVPGSSRTATKNPSLTPRRHHSRRAKVVWFSLTAACSATSGGSWQSWWQQSWRRRQHQLQRRPSTRPRPRPRPARRRQAATAALRQRRQTTLEDKLRLTTPTFLSLLQATPN